MYTYTILTLLINHIYFYFKLQIFTILDFVDISTLYYQQKSLIFFKSLSMLYMALEFTNIFNLLRNMLMMFIQ